MIPNRELGMSDYMAMLRRRAKMIVIPALTATIAGFAVSFAFSPKYTSQSLVLVEGQRVPENIVQPVVSEDLTARVATIEQQILAQSSLQPVIEKLYPGKSGAETNAIIDQIQAPGSVDIEPVVTSLSAIGNTAGKAVRPGQSPVPGFYLKYTTRSAREAQQICNELTSLMISQNLKSIQEVASGTSDVLSRGLQDAKHNLDDMDAKLATFKKQYVGQLPGDEESNLKILTGLNSQLEAQTQTLNRAQQDKAYTESILAQQLATWKSSQETTNPLTLEKQLSELQSQLLQLRAKYTDDHPDVIKTKADIAEVKAKLAEVNKSLESAGDLPNEKASGTEPPEIRQLRVQIHQYQDLIAAATRDQKRLQQEIEKYQGRVSLSPAIEEQYKQLTRDYDVARKSYDDLLAKKNSADLTVQMNNQSQGERMFPLEPANLPDSPSFPNRLLFLAGGLGAGLAMGLALALGLELADNSIRNEADAEAALELPLLTAVPWVGVLETEPNGKFWRKGKRKKLPSDTVSA